MKRKIAAILAADIAGYSRLVAEDEENTLTRLASYREVFEDFVTKAGGRVFNTAGDAVLAEFSSAVEATRCAIDIQESLRTRNLGYPSSKQMLFRIGLTIGDVVEREGDLLGDGVNIAARLEGLAAPGGICVSRSVFEQVANKLSVPFRDIGQQDVKNIPQPIHAFMVEMPGGIAPAPAQPVRQSVLASQAHQKKSAALPLMFGGLALVAGISALALAAWQFGWLVDTRPQQILAKLQPEKPARPLVSEQPLTEKDGPKAKPANVGPAKSVQIVSTKPKSGRPDPANLPVPAGQRETATRTAALPASPKIKDAPADKLGTAEQSILPDAKANPPVKPVSPAKPSTPTKPVIPAGATPAQAFALLSKAGGIVQKAATKPELYHNARVWEARGQAAEARRSYSRLAALGVEAIDAHMRFSAILRAQDGRAGAREIYAALARGKGGRAAVLVHGLQFSGVQRRTRVAAFAAQNPGYVPAQMLLAREYSTDRLGTRTLHDKRRQFAALKNFLKAEDDGSLPKFFMDHSVLTEWVDEARKKHVTLEKYFKTAALAPVASYSRSNQGWMVNISLPEAALSISYRAGQTGNYRPTGTFPHIDQRTGRPMVNPSFELPGNAKATKLQVRYRDANNLEQGPFTLDFDPRKAIILSQRSILERFSNGWIVFGKEGFQAGLLYFTHLVSYRCAIEKAVIAIDDGPLDRPLPIPACSLRDPHAIPRDAKVYLRIPPSAKKVRVQLTFADGGKSEEKTFSRSR